MRYGRYNFKSSRSPVHILTVDNEKFRVRGEDTIYDELVVANTRAKKLGYGTEVERCSDGKLVSVQPTNIPSPPRFHE